MKGAKKLHGTAEVKKNKPKVSFKYLLVQNLILSEVNVFCWQVLKESEHRAMHVKNSSSSKTVSAIGTVAWCVYQGYLQRQVNSPLAESKVAFPTSRGFCEVLG